MFRSIFHTEVFTIRTIKNRLPGILVLFLLLFGLVAMPAHAEDYDTVVSQLEQLQSLANDFIAENNSQADPIVLTLSYTRVGDYNTNMWQMTAGARDPAFENYVAEKNGSLSALQGMGSVTLPGGEAIDFGHLLASMNLVYNGIPIVGSWGGDCMQLAQAYAGQAGDAESYISLMQQTFNLNDDGTNSHFGDQDLRADLDSVNIGSQLKSDTGIAELMRSYYENVSDYDRCHQFISLSYGTIDTADTATFRAKVYNTLIKDAGMQFLLYVNQMWSAEGWVIDPAAEQPVQAACSLFADYLAGSVNNEKVKSGSTTLMVTMGSDALSSALGALGFGDAASAALSAADSAVSSSSADAGSASGNVSGKVDSALNGAAATFQTSFNVQIFQTILLVLAGLAAVLLVVCIVMLIRRR